jgi:hypothetical protein
MNKTELLGKMRAANDAIEQLFASLTDEQISRPGVYDDLSAKDVLAHIAAWQQLEVNWLRDSLSRRGTVRFAPGFEITPDMPESQSAAVTDRLNEYVKVQNSDRPFRDVLEDYRRTHGELVATVAEMSEDDLNSTERFEWWRGEPIWTSVAGNSYEHVDEHVELIRRWLETQGGQRDG